MEIFKYRVCTILSLNSVPLLYWLQNPMEEMLRKSYKRKVFHNQGGRLVARSPELKEEVTRRVLYLNNKWEKLEQLVTPRKRSHTDRIDVCIGKMISKNFEKYFMVLFLMRCVIIMFLVILLVVQQFFQVAINLHI